MMRPGASTFPLYKLPRLQLVNSPQSTEMDRLETPQLQTGLSLNLLNGYKSSVFLDRNGYIPFTVGDKQALFYREPVVTSPGEHGWSAWPEISLHNSAEQLVSALLQIKLRPFEDRSSEGGGVSVWPAGALMLAGLTEADRSTALKNVSTEIGLDLSTPEWSYALVRHSRTANTATHPCVASGLFRLVDLAETLRPETLEALKQLQKLGNDGPDVNKDGAEGYLRFFSTFGTHFVSIINSGDCLFQVFAYSSSEFQFLMDFYSKNPNYLSGPTAPSFAQFTVQRNNQSGYGHAAAIGSICLASSDPALPETLAKGLWHDGTYALANSIFTPYLRPNSVNINTAFQMTVVTGLELASLSSFAEYIRKHIWHIILKAALYVKYARGKDVAPYFSNNCPYNLQMAYKDSSIIENDGLVSVIATPTVSICKELVDISSIALQFPDLVKTFDIFSNALLISSPSKSAIQLPGSKTVTIISHVVSVASEAVPPNICLSKSAFENIKTCLSAGEFYGGLFVTSTDAPSSLVIVNGLVFEVFNGKVAVSSDVRIAQSTSIFDSNLTNFELSLVAAEARINFLLSGGTSSTESTNILLMQRYLLWLGRIASSGNKNDTLATLQARALYLAKIASAQQTEGVPIPLLTYRAHKDVVTNVQNVLNTVKLSLMDFQNQIRARKAEERQIDRDKALNENIIESGKLLEGYISAQASYQDSLSGMFEAVVKDTEKNVRDLMNRAKGLSSRLNEQRQAVWDSIEKYKEAVVEWQKNETLRAALSIASSLFLLGFSFITPSGAITALAELGKTVQRIQKAVTIFDAVIKAYESIQSLPNDPQSVIDILNQYDLDFPSELEWDEMGINMEATLATGPDVGAKTDLFAAFSILVVRGKTLMQVEKEIQTKLTELSAGQNRLHLHKQQQERLLQLRAKFNVLPENLDVDAVDLVGMTSQLTFFEREMLMIMASTIVIQDRALQYEYLRPPTPISSFSFMNLQVAVLSQSQSINLGLAVQPQPKLQPNPIVYEIHGVQPSSLINKNVFSFSLPLSKREFASYNYVRIANIKVEIGGILSTDSGQYYTELDFEGQPFFDRGFNGEPLTFQTTSRMYTFIDYVANSSHSIDETSVMAGCDVDQNISMVTPFSTWRISLPPTLTNKGIKFDASRGLTVRLVFCVFAQLKEMPSTLRMQQLRNRNAYSFHGSHVLTKYSSAQLHEGNPHNSDSTPLTVQVSTPDVLSKMSGKSVCAGWDVVLSMTAEQINKNLTDQFNDRVDNPTFVRGTGDITNETTSSEGVVMKTSFNFEFKAPKLQFLLNNSNSAQVFFPIKSGLYEYSIIVNNVEVPIEKASITESDDYYVQGDIPLAVLQGSISQHLNIALKLNGGAFSSQGFRPGTSNPMMNVALTDYFTSLKDGYEVYNLGTLNTDNVTLLPALTPKSFKFNVVHTPSDRDLLQLFITTSGQSQTSTSLYSDEPIPSSYECSLIINSKIFFQSVLPNSLGNTNLGLVINGDGPVKNNGLWQAKAIKGSVTSPFPLEMIEAHSKSTSAGHGSVSITYYENFVGVPDDTVSVDLTGMLFEHGDSKNSWYSKMSFEMNGKEYPFKHGTRSRHCSISCRSWSSVSFSDYSLAVNVKMNAHLKFIIEGTGQDQKVQLEKVDSTNPMITGDLQPPAGLCECNDHDLQKAFLDKLQTGMTPQLTNMLNQQFPAVSLFALKNILFPAQNLLDMKEAYVPGDMVIFGKFTVTK